MHLIRYVYIWLSFKNHCIECLKVLHDLRERRCAGLDNLARDDVRIDNGDAERLELLGHCRLAGGNPARQAYDCAMLDRYSKQVNMV